MQGTLQEPELGAQEYQAIAQLSCWLWWLAEQLGLSQASLAGMSQMLKGCSNSQEVWGR